MNSLFASLPAGNRAEAAPRLKVTILYESVDAGKRAKGFTDRLAIQTAQECPPSLNLWSFNVLGARDLRNLSASAAAAADLVIFSISGSQPLPAPVREWIEMWTWLIDARQPAVVALFADVGPAAVPVQTYLRRHAASRGLRFFQHLDAAPVPVDCVLDLPDRAAPTRTFHGASAGLPA